MTGVGIIMLVHGDLTRAAQVAQYWVRASVPLVIHADRTTPPAQLHKLTDAIADAPRARMIQTQRGQWGSWGLVAATQDAAQVMLEMAPDLGHIALTSGTCLPIKSAAALRAHLAANADVDFIDSHAVGPNSAWVQDGLEWERFTLRFPRFILGRPHLFNAAVKWQRRLGLTRKMPQGLAPHIGKQWWCLRAQTLRAILEDPQRSRIDRFFAQSWIPDESYFQTMARKYAPNIAPSLTLAEFDPRGRPFVLYDEHLRHLQSDPAFFARKVWGGADGLYQAFLSDAPAAETSTPMAELLRSAQTAARRPRLGLVSQSRFASPKRVGLELAHPVVALYGLFDSAKFLQLARRRLPFPFHGRIFAPERLDYDPRFTRRAGAICPSPRIRDKNQRSFLQNLIYYGGDGPQGMLLGAGDGPNPPRILAQSHQARIVICGDLNAAEHKTLAPVLSANAKARVQIVPRPITDQDLGELIAKIRSEFDVTP